MSDSTNNSSARRQQLALQEIAGGRYLRGWKLAEGSSIRQGRHGLFYVNSQTHRGVEYEVIPLIDDKFICNCEDYQTNSKLQEDFKCKHIIGVETWIKVNRDIRSYLDEDPTLVEELFCGSCGSTEIRRWGSHRGIQCFRCRQCGHRFRQEKLLKGFVYTPAMITLCMDLYFSGLSTRKIARNIKSHFHLKIDQSTIFRWIEKFVPIIMEYVETLQPQLSDTWQADELFVKMKKGIDYKAHTRKFENIAFLWNIMDRKTRFLLTSKLSSRRNATAATRAFNDAIRTAKEKLPEKIITDKFPSYRSAIYRSFKRKPSIPHQIRTGIKYGKTSEGYTVSRMERLQGTVKERVKVQRGFKSMKTVIPDGILIQYDFINPHGALGGMTPSDATLIDVPGTDRWKTLLKRAVRKQIQDSADSKKEIETESQ